MEYTVYKTMGSANQTLPGKRFRTFPVSCANRVPDAWSAYANTPAIFGEQRIMAGNRTPNYWARLKKGEWIPPNPFWSTRKFVTSQGSSDLIRTWAGNACTAPNISAWDEDQGLFMPSYNPSNLVTSILGGDDAARLITQVTTECLANRQKGKANYVESLAELDQLFRLPTGPIVALGRFADEFRRRAGYQRMDKLRKRFRVNYAKDLPRAYRNTKLGKEFLRLLSSEYLIWRYGVKPLISDIQAAMESLKTNYRLSKSSDIHTARANGLLTATKTDNYSSSSAYLKVDWSIQTADTFSVHAQWCDRYASTPWTDLGLTWHNLVAVPWELTKRSFVLDWFVNVGELIYANLPRVGVTPLGGSYFTKEQIYHLSYFRGFSDLQPLVVKYTGNLSDSVSIDYLRNQRSTIDPVRGTGLVIKSDFRFDNWTRALDAAALTAQQLAKVIF